MGIGKVYAGRMMLENYKKKSDELANNYMDVDGFDEEALTREMAKLKIGGRLQASKMLAPLTEPGRETINKITKIAEREAFVPMTKSKKPKYVNF